jgi:flagellar export protein FliJ
MAFRFALTPVFRLRQSIQRQRMLQLRAANLDVSRAEERLAKLESILAESVQAESKGLTAGCRAAELQFASILRENLERFRQEFQSEVRKLELLRQKALGEYHQAHREYEVLETLRARQRRDYEQEQSRREQREFDSLYLLQRWHRRS